MGALEGKVALVTGASRGIGAEVAKAYAAEGAQVIITARTVGGLEEVDDAIQEASDGKNRAMIVPMDLLKLDQIDQLITTIAERFGKLDILTLNAAMMGGLQTVNTIDNKVWEKAFTINVHAPFRLLRGCDPLLKLSDSGRVIGVTASQANTPEPFWGLTAITKSAFEQTLKTYALETEKTHIKTTIVDPGKVGTQWLKEAYPGKPIEEFPHPETAVEPFLKAAA